MICINCLCVSGGHTFDLGSQQARPKDICVSCWFSSVLFTHLGLCVALEGFFCPSWKGFQSRNTWYLWLIHFCISWSFLSGDMTCEQEQATWAMMLSLPLIKIMSGLYLSVSPEPSISKYQSAFVFNEPNLETATVLPRRDFPNKKHKCWRHSAG